MSRVSKQAQRRAVSPRRPRPPAKKTGPKEDKLPKGFREHENALDGELAAKAFIPKIR